MLSFLLLLSGSDSSLHFTEFALVFSVSKYLHTSLLFSLHSQQLFGFFCIRFQHFLFSKLVLSFIHYCLFLGSVQSFEMIWLNTVTGETWLLSSRVFSHKVVIQCKVFVMSSLQLFFSKPCSILISLFFRHLSICILVCYFHCFPLSCMLRLRILKQLVEMLCLLEESIVSGSFLLLVKFFLSDLLGGPVSLL